MVELKRDINKVAELKSTVSLIGDNLIEMVEIDTMTPESVEIKFKKTRELTSEDKEYCLLVDASRIKPPDGKTRMAIQTEFKSCKKLRHVALFNGQNLLINVIASFVLGKLEVDTTSIVKTREQALEALKPYIEISK